MNLLETGEIVELDHDKEYIVVKEAKLDGISYLYLMSNFKPLEVRFAKQNIVNDKLQVTFIEKQEEKIKVLKLFTNNTEK